ncbi:hypothetical protein OH491_00430 [Termitidicoccus mucosus]|uniref:Uncharacterized protein n=1 Tax=Termitidicoccus mucosus TaxID=1184151 RepID=A0A178IB60_9BACT|nr:hypothetical protein AW736_24925 [Opitutaceae bacterium TSB47]
MPSIDPQAPAIPHPAAAPRVVLAGGFDDAGRARWVRRLLGEIAARAPETRCTLVRAVPDTLCPGPKKEPAPPAPVTQLTLLERRPPCLCCPDSGLVDELARLTSAERPAWLIVEIPAATLVWTREELRRALPESRLFSVMVRRPSAAKNGACTALWDLSGLADFDVLDGDSAENAIRSIARSDERGD